MPVFCFSMFLLSEPAGNLNNYNFLDKHQEHGSYHCRVGGLAYTCRTARRIPSLIAAYYTYSKAKYYALDKRRVKVDEVKGLKYLLHIGAIAGTFVLGHI